jgi:hypothetical protein
MVLLSTANLSSNAIPIIPTAPVTDGDFEGQTKLLVLSDRHILYIWSNDDNQWFTIPSAITGNVIPIGVITPNEIGQIYIKLDSGNVYISNGLTSSNWRLVA